MWDCGSYSQAMGSGNPNRLHVLRRVPTPVVSGASDICDTLYRFSNTEHRASSSFLVALQVLLVLFRCF